MRDEGGPAIAAKSLTFEKNATRAFELRYWKTIADLATGRYLNKNSGDCVRDSVTQTHLRHGHSDLDALAEYLLDYYRAARTQDENGRPDRHRRSAIPLANRFCLSLDGRLARK